MSNVTIYSTRVCPYCLRAKKLLEQKQVHYTEIYVDDDLAQRELMIAKSGGRRTVPQIFINDKPIGGCDDLYALEHTGQLDELLKA